MFVRNLHDWAIVGVAVALLGAAGCDGRSAEPDFVPGTLNFGRTVPSEKVSGALTFKNPTRSSIRITRVGASCTCTVTSTTLVGLELAPGGSCLVPLTMKAGTLDGPMSSRITIEYEPVGTPRGASVARSAVVETDVRAEFRPSTRLIDFGTVDEETRISRTVRVAAQDVGSSIGLRDASSSTGVSRPKSSIEATAAATRSSRSGLTVRVCPVANHSAASFD